MTQQFVQIQERRKAYARKYGINRLITRSLTDAQNVYVDLLKDTATRAFAPFELATVRTRGADTSSVQVSLNEPVISGVSSIGIITLDANSFVELSGEAIFGFGLLASGAIDVEITVKKGGALRTYGIT